MKSFFFPFALFSFLSFTTVFSIEEDHEVETVQQLMRVTEQNLEDQKQLLAFLKDYKEKRFAYTQDKENREQAGLMVESAHTALQFIEEHHLNHLFTQEFLKELQFFEQFAKQTES